jgi:PAS domain S-box-containing protein
VLFSVLLLGGSVSLILWQLHRQQSLYHSFGGQPAANEKAAAASVSLWWASIIPVFLASAGLLGAGLVIRRLHRASDSLAQSEERVRAIIDNALDAVVTMDSAGHITAWNPRAEVIFRWTRREAIGRILSETIIPSQFRQAHERGVKHFMNSGEGPVLNKRIEITALRRNGEEFPIELSVTPLKEGKSFTFSAFIRDISDRKAAEAELEKAHKELVAASREAGRAEMATGVLHNVGNVLNSVIVSSSIVADTLRRSKLGNLGKIVALIREHQGDLGVFLSSDSKGVQIPGYLASLVPHLQAEQAATLKELAALQKNIEHIKDIVVMQQSYAKLSGAAETVNVSELVEDALRMNANLLQRQDMETIRAFSNVPPVTVQRQKVLQILVNLIRNAKQACDESGRAEKRLTLQVANGDGRVKISVIDNGVGISADNLARIFSHGFTTKKDGHGFGLHSGIVAAKEMGGSLTAHSDGPGTGATFTLELPLGNAPQSPDVRNQQEVS